MPTIDESISLATDLHAGESDLTGAPYIEHPLWVMRALPPTAAEDDRHLAVLHDVIEHCRPRLAKLMQEMHLAFDRNNPIVYLNFFRQRGYSQYVTDGLMLLSRDMWSGGSYAAHIQHIIDAGHHGALMVKYFECRHNADPARLARLLPEHQARAAALATQYNRGRKALAAALSYDD